MEKIHKGNEEELCKKGRRDLFRAGATGVAGINGWVWLIKETVFLSREHSHGITDQAMTLNCRVKL